DTGATAGGGLIGYFNPFAYSSTTLFYMFSLLKFASSVYLFHKALLPLPIARYFGRVFHFFTAPFVLAMQYSGLRGNLIDRIGDGVYLGAAPYSWNMQQLLVNNIGAVVNLCDEYGGPVTLYAKHNIRQLYLPTVDHYEPELSELRTAIKFIEQEVDSGNNVFIHCKAGRGRSGAVAICWVAYRHHKTLEQAQQILLERRSKVRKSLYKQKNVLAFYSKYCVNGVP
ncbi:hypothetical protein SAMD00019534_122460, partial [Acytostelium subglobosum LB1]|uniref:hypothetical protein n=1 Tax=Acytostelium subglobosum LB1 TaxID=1410327 RepID=UPI000644A956